MTKEGLVAPTKQICPIWLNTVALPYAQEFVPIPLVGGWSLKKYQTLYTMCLPMHKYFDSLIHKLSTETN
jgi:hypothetical protein